jgi:hypothetical protein
VIHHRRLILKPLHRSHEKPQALRCPEHQVRPRPTSLPRCRRRSSMAGLDREEGPARRQARIGCRVPLFSCSGSRPGGLCHPWGYYAAGEDAPRIHSEGTGSRRPCREIEISADGPKSKDWKRGADYAAQGDGVQAVRDSQATPRSRRRGDRLNAGQLPIAIIGFNPLSRADLSQARRSGPR